MDVVLVRWPLERQRREALARDGRARLLLVEGDGVPPISTDCFEDWIRVPAPDADVRRRVQDLAGRAARHQPAAPVLDPDGVLRYGEAWTSLPPVDARLARALIERYGTVVNREVLSRAGWPGGQPGRNALDVHVLRLRRRLGAVGLAIRTVRSRGYMLEAAEPDQLTANA